MNGLQQVVTGEIVDLSEAEAVQITARIRNWVNSYPVDEVTKAFRGRIWLAMSYSSWDEWCECELGGFQLPALERQRVVVELASVNLGTDEKPVYMSNTAIAEATGVSHVTVGRDIAATGTNVRVELQERAVLSQDGKVHRPRQKREKKQDVAMTAQSEADLINLVNATIVQVLRQDRVVLYSDEAKRFFISALESALASLKGEQP